ncbi:MAG: hypothetical protein WBO04_16295 [Steroidobacteraceae bacterium]
MFTLRCTRKLLKRLGARPSSEAITPTTVLGDWYANLLYRRPQQLVLAMNERSLLCVLVPAVPVDQLGQRLGDAVADLLLEIGVPSPLVAAELQAMETMAVGATASRAVLGCMNDAVMQLEAYPAGHAGQVALRDLTLHLAENIYSLTNYAPPGLKALELLGVTTDVRRLREGSRLH